MDLPKYKSHKVVGAVKIAAVEIHEDDSATIAPVDGSAFKTKPDWKVKFPHQSTEMYDDEADLGYFIEYEDGYQSWSPSKAFEEGYTRI